MLDLLEELQGGLSGVSGRRGEVGAKPAELGLVAKKRTLAFTLREVGATEGSGERKDESDSSHHGEKSMWGKRTEVRRPRR